MGWGLHQIRPGPRGHAHWRKTIPVPVLLPRAHCPPSPEPGSDSAPLRHNGAAASLFLRGPPDGPPPLGPLFLSSLTRPQEKPRASSAQRTLGSRRGRRAPSVLEAASALRRKCPFQERPGLGLRPLLATVPCCSGCLPPQSCGTTRPSAAPFSGVSPVTPAPTEETAAAWGRATRALGGPGREEVAPGQADRERATDAGRGSAYPRDTALSPGSPRARQGALRRDVIGGRRAPAGGSAAAATRSHVRRLQELEGDKRRR